MTEYKTKVGYYPPIELHYEEPVWDAMNKAAEEVVANIRNDTDRMVIGACMKVGVSVDKDELVRALRYDRGQYEKGYADGKRDAADEIEALQAEKKKTVTQIFGEEQQEWEEYCTGLMNRIKEIKAQLPKRGEWIVDGMYTYNLRELNGEAYEPVYRCSCCNRQMESYLRLDEPKMPEDADFPEYCPHCGAKMTGEQDVE